MKSFIYKIIIFLIPMFLVAIALEFAVRNIPNEYAYKHQYLTSDNDYQNVVLGSSHSYFGINPEYFSRPTFNASHVAQDLIRDSIVFESIDLKKLKCLIIPVSYFTFVYKDFTEPFRLKYYEIYYASDLYNSYDLKNKLELTSFKIAVNSCVSYYLRKKSIVDIDEKGWCKNYNIENRTDIWSDENHNTAKRHTYFANVGTDFVQRNKDIMKYMIQKCSQNNIKVILVTTPTYRNYYNYLDDTQLKEMQDICSDLNNSYMNTFYLNYLKDDRFDDEDFFDSDHLNSNGAKRFSMILNSDIEKILTE